jgi:hypothetical protein
MKIERKRFIEDFTLGDLLAYVNGIKAANEAMSYDDFSFGVVYDDYNGSASAYIYYKTEETEDEMKRRLEQEVTQAERVRLAEFQQYERLKKKYG